MAKDKCDLSNEELIEKCNEWVSKLAKSGGRDWRLHVPVSFNSDPDMLFCELANRFKALTTTPPTGWVKVEEQTPVAFKSGNWDGLRSELVLTKNKKTGVYKLAVLYEGTLDGNHFKDWYDADDFDIEQPTHWMDIPTESGMLSIEQILELLKTVDYPVWGHGMPQFWFYDGKWHAGLRNYKTDPVSENPSVFASVSPYAALASLYNFCVEKGHIQTASGQPGAILNTDNQQLD